VLERKLAPFFKGEDDAGGDKEECPICMLYYPGGLNRSNCCRQGICSECFLQVSPRANRTASCPFCKRENYATTFRGPMNAAERERLQEEEQRAIEAQIGTRNREEKAYLDRLAERGMMLPPGLLSGSDAQPIPGAQRISSPAADAAIHTSIHTAVGRDGSRGASLGATPPGESPFTSFTASPMRLATSIHDEDDETQTRWLEAQRRAAEQAMRGSHTASPPTVPLLDRHRASEHLRAQQARRESRESAGAGEAADSWQDELEELMLLEAIRQSLQDGQPPLPPPPLDTSIGPSGSPSGPKPIGAHPARDGAPSLMASGQSLSAAASVSPLTPPAAIGAPFSPTSSANGGWTSTAAVDAAVNAGIPAEIPAEILAGVGGPTPPDSPEIQVARSSSMAS